MISTLKAHPYWPTSSSKALPSRDSTTFPVTSWDQVFKHMHLWGKFWIRNTVHVQGRVEFNWVKKEKKTCICMLYTSIKHTCTYVYTSILDLAWGRDQRTRDRLQGWRGPQVGAITVPRADTAKGRYVVSSPERQAPVYILLLMLSFLRRDSMPQGSENLLWWTYWVI